MIHVFQQKTRSNHVSFPSVLNNLKQLPLTEFTHTQKNSNNHPEKMREPTNHNNLQVPCL